MTHLNTQEHSVPACSGATLADVTVDSQLQVSTFCLRSAGETAARHTDHERNKEQLSSVSGCLSETLKRDGRRLSADVLF